MEFKFLKNLFILLIISIVSLNCANKTDDNFFHKREFSVDPFTGVKIKLDEKNIKYYEDGPNGIKEYFNGEYKLTTDNSFTILSVKDKSFVIFYLIDTLILIDRNSGKVITGTDYSIFGQGASDEPNIHNFDNINANSFLKEKDIEYLPLNLEKFFYLPWVEGEKGDGIGSKLDFDLFDVTNNIIIANGFFNPKYLNLYNENNRIKKIKIKLLDVNLEMITDLKDTYNLQMIKLPKKSKKLEIEILEVYKGTKYSDTCISGLFTNYKMAMKEQ